jgi:hypothetical protein
MKIFIPKNLTNIEIISQLKKMIDGYEDYYEETSNPFDNYYYYLKNDDVKRFISLCLDETKIDSSQEYSEVLNYICRLFYSVKGTPLVFDYIENEGENREKLACRNNDGLGKDECNKSDDYEA